MQRISNDVIFDLRGIDDKILEISLFSTYSNYPAL